MVQGLIDRNPADRSPEPAISAALGTTYDASNRPLLAGSSSIFCSMKRRSK
jgi:hypothetical protein